MTDTIVARVEQITTGEVPGLVGTDTQPISESVDEQVARAVAQRTAVLRRFLAVVTPLPVTERPWVPDLSAATGGGRQPAEKAEFPTALLNVTGQTYTPDLVGGAWNVSWQVMQAAPSAIDALLQELALRRVVEHVLGVMTDHATVAADLKAGVAAVEDAGYPVDLMLGSTSVMLTQPVAALDAIGVRLFGGLPLDGVLVGSLAGTYGASSEVTLRQAEPAIGGYEVAAFAEVVMVVAPGSMAFVAAA